MGQYSIKEIIIKRTYHYGVELRRDLQVIIVNSEAGNYSPDVYNVTCSFSGWNELKRVDFIERSEEGSGGDTTMWTPTNEIVHDLIFDHYEHPNDEHPDYDSARPGGGIR